MAILSCEKALDLRQKIAYKPGIPYWIDAPGMNRESCQKYHKLISAKLSDAKSRRELHLVAKQTGIIATRLSEFLQNSRIVNEKYIIQFVRGGFVKVSELIGTWNGTEKPEEKEFILALKVFENPRFLKAMAEIEANGDTDTALSILETLAKKK
jgi:hypothetical protein